MDGYLILPIVLAIAETAAIYFLTEKSVSFHRWKKVVFYCIVLLYEIYNVPGIFADENKRMAKIILIILISFVFFVIKKGKDIWGLVGFYNNILIFRSVCQLFKFIFLTIYCKADMQLVEQYMGHMPQTIFLFYILFCIPGFFVAKYIWKQFLLCSPSILRITELIMLAIYFITDFLREWVQILTTMPSVLLLFTLVNIWRIAYQNVGEHKLEYYKELEKQVEETDCELAEIRKEVEKYYKQANEEEHYSRQLLQKIDEIRGLK